MAVLAFLLLEDFFQADIWNYGSILQEIVKTPGLLELIRQARLKVITDLSHRKWGIAP